MIGGWWARLRRASEARALARRAIPDALWQLTLARLPFLGLRPAEDLAELRRLTSLFLDRKEFSGAGGLVLRDDMAVAIAAQACLPVLRLPGGLAGYDGFVGIVVHPGQVVARRELTDDDGVVHAWDDVLAGEAVPGGPVMLSWEDAVSPAGAEHPDPGQDVADGWAYNVVVHEFAHVLDMADGLADGMPPLPDAAARQAWASVLEPAYQAFCDEVDQGLGSVLDPYGAESIDEFFAVATEAFFVSPQALRDDHPALYRLLAGYYRQDPAAHPG